MNRPAIFLDRDGTLIEDTHYPRDPSKVRLIPGAIEALRKLQGLGFMLFVVSNQSGVGRGLIKDSEFRKVHERFFELLKQEGIEILECAYCFHKPEDLCGCRKPQTELVLKLAKDFSVDLKRSFTIGDKWIDALLGFRVGATGILLASPDPGPVPAELKFTHSPTFSNWSEIFQFIEVQKPGK